jgi:hypothetical protein
VWNRITIHPSPEIQYICQTSCRTFPFPSVPGISSCLSPGFATPHTSSNISTWECIARPVCHALFKYLSRPEPVAGIEMSTEQQKTCNTGQPTCALYLVQVLRVPFFFFKYHQIVLAECSVLVLYCTRGGTFNLRWTTHWHTPCGETLGDGYW